MQLSGRHAGLIIPVAMVGAAVLTVTVLGRPADTAMSAATPADGTSVGTPPAAVTLTFTAPVAEAHVAVSGADLGGPPAISGGTVTQPVTMTAAGRHVVTYHVVTRGGEVAGSLSFTAGRSGGSGGSGGPAPVPPPATASAHQHDHGAIDGLTLAVLGANGLAALVLGALFVRGHRRPRPDGRDRAAGSAAGSAPGAGSGGERDHGE